MTGERRLIDANELYLGKFLDARTDYHIGWNDALDAAASQANTVDAVEVVHGQWIAVPSSDMMTGKAYCCSECKKMRYGSFMPNYCSNCGAKMDGGADNGI